MPTCRPLLPLLAVGVWAVLLSTGGTAETDYLRDLKPLLAERCYACHGAAKQKGGLRLDTVDAMLQGGDTGPAVQRGKPNESLLIEKLTHPDSSERMPPEEEGTRFTAGQVAALREWIAAGAPAPGNEAPDSDPTSHWAFQPRVRRAVPGLGHPIDAFLSQRRDELGLVPQPEASRAVLLRRLYIDLIGLPPGAEELSTFEADTSPGWYERAVDRLLADPRHGERWARHWMDIWRYSDWWGLGAQLRNSQRHLWHWRDWIVESLNLDIPYDEMVRQMLAADELYPSELDKLRATGFLARNWYLFNRHQWMDETVEHVSKGFLGITMNCAKCHDHKYDPISQVDFYKMRAFFEPYLVRIDMVPGEADLARDGIPRAFDALLDTPTYRFIRGNEAQPDQTEAIAPGIPEVLAFKPITIKTVSLPVEAWRPERRPWVLETHLAAARKAVATTFPNQGQSPTAALAHAAAVAELTSVEARARAMRLSWTHPEDAGEATQAATQAAIQAERQASLCRATHALAVAETNLSTTPPEKRQPAMEQEVNKARAARDKVAKAVVTTIGPEDQFTPLAGAQSPATRFVTSTADDPAPSFASHSTGRRTALADWITDPRHPLTARVAVNHLWSRHLGAPFVPSMFEFGRKSAPPLHPELLDWLACELVESGWSMKHVHRLIVTSAAYRMSSSSAGAASNLKKDPDNHFWWRRVPVRIESQVVRDSILALAGELDLTRGGPPVPLADQARSKRRSLYFTHSNNDRNTFLTTFDDADVRECYRREQSIVPQQALALSNSALVLDHTARIAARIGTGIAPQDDAAFVRQVFRAVLGTFPSEEETSACLQTLAGWRRLPGSAGQDARSHLVWALLNHNDFVTLR